ncbi:MAG TPA: P22 phage major capsid protein family protein, partial [Tepidisphaeraceae bacterium]|nr:P22 phage major capsid protein family protein [Tepidisphaeraceae bacterium]
MANTLLTIGMITRRALMTLENNLVTTKYVTREYDDQFAVAGAKIGNVLNVRKPPRFVRTDGQALQLQDVTETSTPVTLTTQAQRSFAFTSQEQALDIDDYNERFLEPAMASMANQVDYDILQLFSTVFNEVGTPGAVPNALLTYLQAGVLMDNQAAPKSPRDLIIGSQMQATIVDALKGLFQASTQIAEQYKTGNMGVTAGFRWSMDQNVPTFTVGAQGGTPLVSSTAGQTGASIATTGWTANTKVLNKGDIVQFAGCYAVNPQSRQIVQGAAGNQLANWVVTQDVTSDGAGNANIPISGPSGFGIITGGPFQTCSASPTAGGAVTVNGAGGTISPRGLVFTKSAFTLACADLPLYKGLD